MLVLHFRLRMPNISIFGIPNNAETLPSTNLFIFLCCIVVLPTSNWVVVFCSMCIILLFYLYVWPGGQLSHWEINLLALDCHYCTSNVYFILNFSIFVFCFCVLLFSTFLIMLDLILLKLINFIFTTSMCLCVSSSPLLIAQLYFLYWSACL